jgi:phosphate transport system permease protein
VSSALALIIATPLALGVSIFLSEIAPKWLRQPVGFLVDLLAAIPSVVYGLWGIFVLIPLLRDPVGPFLRDTLKLGATPLFSGPNYGYSMLAAGLILAIMILPFISAVTREVLLAVPQSQRESFSGSAEPSVRRWLSRCSLETALKSRHRCSRPDTPWRR